MQACQTKVGDAVTIYEASQKQHFPIDDTPNRLVQTEAGSFKDGSKPDDVKARTFVWLEFKQRSGWTQVGPIFH